MNGPDASFPRTARLLSAREFQRVFDRAVRSRDSGFTVLARRQDNANGAESGAMPGRDDASNNIANGAAEARLGLAISKRQIRSAAMRNRVKRRIRESFRHRREELGGLDVIVMAKHGVDSWQSDAIFASLARHWEKVIKKCAN